MKNDFEALMTAGLVYHYSKKLAIAWFEEDHEEANQVIEYIRGNYGEGAVEKIGELATELILKM